MTLAFDPSIVSPKPDLAQAIKLAERLREACAAADDAARAFSRACPGISIGADILKATRQCAYDAAILSIYLCSKDAQLACFLLDGKAAWAVQR